MTSKKKRGAPIKQCPECDSTMHARTSQCSCGHIFISKTTRDANAATGIASNEDLIKAAEFVRSVGNIAHARAVLTQLETITNRLGASV